MLSHCVQCDSDLSAETRLDLCADCLRNLGLHSEQTAHDILNIARVPTSAAKFDTVTLDQMAEWFPQYEIIQKLGHGSTSMVYKVRYRHVDHLAALKVLSPKLGQDPAVTDGFSLAARIMSSLNHTNIVTINECGQVDDVSYLTMEYFESINLRELLRSQSLSLDQSRHIAQQISEALRFARSKYVVVRDLFPENVLVERGGRVLLGSSTWLHCRVT